MYLLKKLSKIAYALFLEGFKGAGQCAYSLAQGL